MIILLSGKPGAGKSTVIEKFLADYKRPMSWVITKEIRNSEGERVGFKAINSSGDEALISHKFDIDSDIIIGANKVDLPIIDQLFTQELTNSFERVDILVVVDEIGPIQLLSVNFTTELERLFVSNKNLLATIHFKDEQVEKYKKHSEAILFEVMEENRELLPVILIDIFENISELDQFTEKQREELTRIARKYAVEGKLLEIRKLFKNTLKYLQEKRVVPLDNSDFEVQGDHGRYKVTKVNDNYKCECDFFLGKGKYKKSGECSHIQTVNIFESFNLG